MARHDIPTADFKVFDDPKEARAHARKSAAPIVVKADGLAAGKGVIVAKTTLEAETAIEQIMVEKSFGGAGDRLVVEECLDGEEVSIHAVCAGDQAVLLPSSQDHKRIFDGDKGPNTGGMGAYSPVPRVTSALRDQIRDTIILPTLRGMNREGHPFSGVLYAGLMITREGPKVLEYNVRFGDPETQALLALIESDVAELLYASAGGELPEGVELHAKRCAATVVVASRGYPGAYEKGRPVRGLEEAEDESRVVFHAGTQRTPEGIVTTGGRVLSVTAWGSDLSRVIAHAYEGVAKVAFDGAYFRTDIGRRALPDSAHGDDQ
jgi:phosphoribosylamine--glycine ligase